MAEKTIQGVSALTGQAPVYEAAAGGDFIIPADGDTKLLVHVKNTDTAEHSLTLDDINSSGPAGAAQFNPDVTIAVPAGAERVFVLTELQRFKNSNGQIPLNWSLTTGMSVGVFRLR